MFGISTKHTIIMERHFVETLLVFFVEKENKQGRGNKLLLVSQIGEVDFVILFPFGFEEIITFGLNLLFRCILTL